MMVITGHIIWDAHQNQEPLKGILKKPESRDSPSPTKKVDNFFRPFPYVKLMFPARSRFSSTRQTRHKDDGALRYLAICIPLWIKAMTLRLRISWLFSGGAQ